jgi:iron(III) transport system substrate-binding protein
MKGIIKRKLFRASGGWAYGWGLALAAAGLLAGCSGSKREVIVYTSQDEVYAEPVFKAFTARTGVPIRAVYDSEAVKTVGLANRLLAERPHPECDVFWNNEEFRTRLLASEGIFDPASGWVSLGHRSRRVVVNPKLVSRLRYPKGLDDLTNSFWRGHVAVAYPMFGTTSTYFFALRRAWGEARWRTWCQNLAANKPFMVDGNSVVVKFVGDGQAWAGLTDSDDIYNAQKDGAPVEALPLTKESLLIHNTAGLIAQAPHAADGRMLLEFLASPETARTLIAARALEGVEDEPDGAGTMKVDWEGVLADVDAATKELQAVFMRNE